MKMIFTLITVFILSITGDCYSQKINSEAISKFWNVVDYLKLDKELTDSVWSSYYNLSGNKNYMLNNRSEENVLEHRKYLELIFRPSFSDSLKKIEKIKNSDHNEDIFQNLYFIKLNEEKLRNYSKEVESPDYLPLSIKLSKKYLPKNKYNSIPANLTIYLMAITYDAAVQDSSMYFGLACVYDLDRFQKGSTAAHELHHLLRKNLECGKGLSKTDSASVSIVDQINNEGCADLIDKTIIIDNESKILIGSLLKDWLMGSADITIQKIDSCLILNSRATLIYATDENFREITGFSSGHIPGFYMVDIIKRNGYLKELIKNNDDPFNFFYLYNKAAKKDKRNPSRFSDETIEYLKRLESKLIKS